MSSPVYERAGRHTCWGLNQITASKFSDESLSPTTHDQQCESRLVPYALPRISCAHLLCDPAAVVEIRVARRVFVNNLTYATTWHQLKDFFSAAGNGACLNPHLATNGRSSAGCVKISSHSAVRVSLECGRRLILTPLASVTVVYADVLREGSGPGARSKVRSIAAFSWLAQPKTHLKTPPPPPPRPTPSYLPPSGFPYVPALSTAWRSGASGKRTER